MPNHVLSEITLKGVRLEDIQAQILNEEGFIDFEILLPLPINHWPGGVSKSHEDAFLGTHLDDARNIWGTKWNAYGQDEGGKYQSVVETEEGVVLTFQTAWNHPRGWTCALFNTLKCDIIAKWLSEGGWVAHVEEYNYSALKDLGGEAWKDTELEENCAEHRRLHKLLWGVEEFEDEEE